MQVNHKFVSAIPNDPAAVAAGEVVPSNWNDTHNVTGTASALAGYNAAGVSVDVSVNGDATINTATGVVTVSKFNGGTAFGTLAGQSGTFSGTSSGTNTGDVTLAAVGSTPSANAASLSGQILTLQPADNTNPGVLTSGTQNIGGAKTYSALQTFSAGETIAAGQSIEFIGSGASDAFITYGAVGDSTALAIQSNASGTYPSIQAQVGFQGTAISTIFGFFPEVSALGAAGGESIFYAEAEDTNTSLGGLIAMGVGFTPNNGQVIAQIFPYAYSSGSLNNIGSLRWVASNDWTISADADAILSAGVGGAPVDVIQCHSIDGSTEILGNGLVDGNLQVNGGNGFNGVSPVGQQSVGTSLINNITSGGTTGTLANYTSLTVYSLDAAAIRDNLYQLGLKVAALETASKNVGLNAT